MFPFCFFFARSCMVCNMVFLFEAWIYCRLWKLSSILQAPVSFKTMQICKVLQETSAWSRRRFSLTISAMYFLFLRIVLFLMRPLYAKQKREIVVSSPRWGLDGACWGASASVLRSSMLQGSTMIMRQQKCCKAAPWFSFCHAEQHATRQHHDAARQHACSKQKHT